MVIDYLDERNAEKVHATGQKAVYDFKVVNSTTNATLELTGNPAVEFSPTAITTPPKPAGWMTADVITLDRAGGNISGAGNHHSVLKRLPDEAATMDTEIFSDQFAYAMATGLAVYQGNVRAFDPEVNLTGRKTTVTIARGGEAGTNRIERILDEGGVTVDFAGKPFATGDITNLAAFAGRLKQPKNAISQFVSAQLAAPTRQLLAGYTNGPAPGLQADLAEDLNRVAQSGAVYEAGRFDGIFLSPDSTRLIRQQPMGMELVQLNRLLLLDAFRGEIARNPNAEKIHGTGEQAVYSSHVAGGVTNVVLELSGKPRLDEPDRWVTADKSIILDRTTGRLRLIGDHRIHFKLQAVTENKPPGEKKNAPK